jgi:hypothetical protein
VTAVPAAATVTGVVTILAVRAAMQAVVKVQFLATIAMKAVRADDAAKVQFLVTSVGIAVKMDVLKVQLLAPSICDLSNPVGNTALDMSTVMALGRRVRQKVATRALWYVLIPTHLIKRRQVCLPCQGHHQDHRLVCRHFMHTLLPVLLVFFPAMLHAHFSLQACHPIALLALLGILTLLATRTPLSQP